jgi:hypothetical protein
LSTSKQQGALTLRCGKSEMCYGGTPLGKILQRPLTVTLPACDARTYPRRMLPSWRELTCAGWPGTHGVSENCHDVLLSTMPHTA